MMDGSLGIQAGKVQEFADRLVHLFPCVESATSD